MNLFDMIAEDEAKALAATRAEIEAEKAAYAALPPEEKARLAAEAAARWDALAEAEDLTREDDDDEEDEE